MGANQTLNMHLMPLEAKKGSMGFGMVGVAKHQFPQTSESLNSQNEAVVQAELERYFYKAKKIIFKNKEFLDAIVGDLLEKETLLSSDIKRIRERFKIIDVQR